MADFSTEAEVVITPTGLDAARADIEEQLSDDPIQVDVETSSTRGMTRADGGGAGLSPSRQRRFARREHRWARQRTQDTETAVELLDDIEGKVGGGDGGGGLAELLGIAGETAGSVLGTAAATAIGTTIGNAISDKLSDESISVDTPDDGIPVDVPDGGIPLAYPEAGVPLAVPEGGIALETTTVSYSGPSALGYDGPTTLGYHGPDTMGYSGPSTLDITVPPDGVPLDIPAGGVPVQSPSGGGGGDGGGGITITQTGPNGGGGGGGGGGSSDGSLVGDLIRGTGDASSVPGFEAGADLIADFGEDTGVFNGGGDGGGGGSSAAPVDQTVEINQRASAEVGTITVQVDAAFDSLRRELERDLLDEIDRVERDLERRVRDLENTITGN